MRRPLRPSPLRRAAALAATALALALGLAAGPAAAPAGAHEGDAVITIEAAHPAGTSVHYIVRVTWEDDGHPAADATVTATGVSPDGEQLTPVTLAPSDDDGRYAGIVEYPAAGTWTVRITSIDPTGSAEQAQEVTAPATTAPAEDGGAGTGGSDEGFAPADDGTGGSAGGDEDDSATSPDAAGDDSDSGMPIYLLVAAGAVVVIGALTAVSVIRRNRAELAGGSAAGPTSRDDGNPSGRSGTAAAGPDDGDSTSTVAGRPDGDPRRQGDA
jgi:hypothetical protein